MYDEAAFISRCSSINPLNIQWLYKELTSLRTRDENVNPLANFYTHFHLDNGTHGSGKSCRDWKIEHEVGLDWLKWAIQHNLWGVLVNNERVQDTFVGQQMMKHKIEDVLNYARNNGLISTFTITESKSKNGVYSAKFNCELTHSILGVDKVQGNVNY